ncbi:MAG: protease complex subunit PrcB family protein [candidate division WOR-3 bacterium]
MNAIFMFLLCGSGTHEYVLGFEEFYNVSMGGFDRETLIVVADEESFAGLWGQVMGYMMDKPAAIPRVDFETQLVLAYFPGTRPTLGYKFEVKGLSLVKGKNPMLVMRVKETPPKEVAAQMISHPVLMLRVNKSDGPSEWWEKGFRVSVEK